MDRLTAYRADEEAVVQTFLSFLAWSPEISTRVSHRARKYTEAIRARPEHRNALDLFLQEYGLSSAEGTLLMCLAEALLRIPDPLTRDQLIRDKINGVTWEVHLGQSDTWWVNASTWALAWGGQMIERSPSDTSFLKKTWKNLLNRLGDPVMRQAISRAVSHLGSHFVVGETITLALKRAAFFEQQGVRYSFDMLGEAAHTFEEADNYFQRYWEAIEAVGKAHVGKTSLDAASVSIKLSALHPRYSFHRVESLCKEWVPRLLELVLHAQNHGIQLIIDAEESERLELSLAIFEALYGDPKVTWDGLGLAVQAYQKRAFWVIDFLKALFEKCQKKIPVRLVKGAYWDSEIKRSQVGGYVGYPVFTRKSATDISYLACAQKLWEQADAFHLQFATHNAHTVAAIVEQAGHRRDFEFQRLHGMGEHLYAHLAKADRPVPCRVYAPVGSYHDLLGYLVRRLLENGANTSFVQQLADPSCRVDDLIRDPVAEWQSFAEKPHPAIPLPGALFGVSRLNAEGVDLSDPVIREPFLLAVQSFFQTMGMEQPISPISEVVIENALTVAERHAASWARTPIQVRQAVLYRLAEQLEANRALCVALLCREAGKTIENALSEVREAVDFCRYYAEQAGALFDGVQTLPGPTGERNQMGWMGRGVVACISPWNFPLAITVGQMVAALVAGNAVLVKPAEQTPQIAFKVVHWLKQAGLPEGILHFLPGPGETVGAALVRDERVKAVLFTGSTTTAKQIQRDLASRQGSIVPLIAETGGINVMVADSSALLEQLVGDVMVSAFDSAGQRCSSLRVLCLQEEIVQPFLKLLKGAMNTWRIGDPLDLETDSGPLIDRDAFEKCERHVMYWRERGRVLHQTPLGPQVPSGHYFPPTLIRLERIADLSVEVFGPILHVVSYDAKKLDALIQEINQTGYGLTFGIHSRVDGTIQRIKNQVNAGNVYINRHMIGAVVGVQPFGGWGLSGTGPKAGGPEYLKRLAVEYTWSEDTTASGGNASLLCLPSKPVAHRAQ